MGDREGAKGGTDKKEKKLEKSADAPQKKIVEARHAQSRLKFERDALFCETSAHCRVVPERDHALTASLNHASRVLDLLVPVVSCAGRATATTAAASAEECLPARTRAHAHLERALRRQRPRASARLPWVVRRDEAGKRLFDSLQWRQAHAQATQVVRQVLERDELAPRRSRRSRLDVTWAARGTAAVVAFLEEAKQEGDGAHEVEVDDGAPCLGLGVERSGRVLELEVA